MSELQEALPSIVVEARDAEGHDLSDVRLLVDGAVLATKLDGSAIALDPGPHTLRFEHGGAGVEQSVVVREGERRRRIPVNFPAPVAPPEPTPPPAPAVTAVPVVTSAPVVTPPPEPLAPRTTPLPAPRSVPVATIALGSIGAASLTVSAIVGLIAKRQFADLDARCAHRCDPSAGTPIRNRMIGADVALGAGLVAVGAAAIVWLARPRAPAPAAVGGR
jgi:hypothetical protein